MISLLNFAIIGIPLVIAARAFIAFTIEVSIFASAFGAFYVHNH